MYKFSRQWYFVIASETRLRLFDLQKLQWARNTCKFFIVFNSQVWLTVRCVSLQSRCYFCNLKWIPSLPRLANSLTGTLFSLPLFQWGISNKSPASSVKWICIIFKLSVQWQCTLTKHHNCMLWLTAAQEEMEKRCRRLSAPQATPFASLHHRPRLLFLCITGQALCFSASLATPFVILHHRPRPLLLCITGHSLWYFVELAPSSFYVMRIFHSELRFIRRGRSLWLMEVQPPSQVRKLLEMPIVPRIILP